MRKLLAAALIVSATSLSVAAPVQAQQQGGQSTGERILQGVLEALRPKEEPQQPQPAQPTVAQTPLEQALNDPRRENDRARDAWRHPAETLKFFQVEPGMTVVDYMPAEGWYSRILIPYLGRNGVYVGLNPVIDPKMTGYWDTYRDAERKIPADAREWVGFEGARVIGADTANLPRQLEGRADRVLVFREFHNMRQYGWLHDSMLAFRKLLKPNGLVGVVQHRARPGTPASYTLGSNGYQREQDVIAIFDAYGFDLVSRSEINANPNDPANWDGGVWALPPGYRGANTQAERARRAAIGESDRMTLLFRMRP